MGWVRMGGNWTWCWAGATLISPIGLGSHAFGGWCAEGAPAIVDVISDMRESVSDALELLSCRLVLFRRKAGSTLSGIGPALIRSNSAWKLYMRPSTLDWYCHSYTRIVPPDRDRSTPVNTLLGHSLSVALTVVRTWLRAFRIVMLPRDPSGSRCSKTGAVEFSRNER